MPGQAQNAALQLFGFIPEPKKQPNPALFIRRHGRPLPVCANTPDLPVKGLLKVQAYVHNRLTICSYQGGSRRVAKRMKAKDLSAVVAAKPNLDILRKTRRQLKIGGRWREKPLTTDFTSRAKNMIRDASSIIETDAGGVPLFLTLTCPGGTENVFEAFGIAAGYIVDRFNRWLRYKVQNGWFCYVWELQGRGAPHLHYLFKIEAGSNFSHFYKEVRREYRKILLDVCEESGVDLFERGDGTSHAQNPNLPVINFRKVKTSVAGYIAKYASKGRSKGVRGVSFSPGRWWGVSYPLRREVLKRRISFIVGMTEIEAASERLLECVERLGKTVEKIWRCDSGPIGPGEFVSLIVRGGTVRDCADAIRSWLIDGDTTGFANLAVIPNMVPPAPA